MQNVQDVFKEAVLLRRDGHRALSKRSLLEARDLLLEALEIGELCLDGSTQDVEIQQHLLKCREDLAICYYQQEDIAAAKGLDRETLDLTDKWSRGTDFRRDQACRIRHRLAKALSTEYAVTRADVEKLEEAVELLRINLQAQDEQSDLTSVAETRSSIAFNLAELSRCSKDHTVARAFLLEAATFLERVVESTQKTILNIHDLLKFFAARHNYAAILHLLGKYEKAKEFFEQNLAALEELDASGTPGPLDLYDDTKLFLEACRQQLHETAPNPQSQSTICDQVLVAVVSDASDHEPQQIIDTQSQTLTDQTLSAGKAQIANSTEPTAHVSNSELKLDLTSLPMPAYSASNEAQTTLPGAWPEMSTQSPVTTTATPSMNPALSTTPGQNIETFSDLTPSVLDAEQNRNDNGNLIYDPLDDASPGVNNTPSSTVVSLTHESPSEDAMEDRKPTKPETSVSSAETQSQLGDADRIVLDPARDYHPEETPVPVASIANAEGTIFHHQGATVNDSGWQHNGNVYGTTITYNYVYNYHYNSPPPPHANP